MTQKGKYLSTILLFFPSLIALLPFYIMFMMSTHYSEELFQGIPLLPGKDTWINLKTIFSHNFIQYYGNSIYVSVMATVLCILISAMAGYGLSKYQYKWRKKLFTFVVLTMMVPSQLGLVGYVMEMKYLGLLGSFWPLIIPFAVNGFGVFWMTQYIRGIPDEIIESARIEGCSEIRLFFQIVLPFIIPAISTLSILMFLWSWNSFLLPLIMINDPKSYTIPLGISTLGNYFRTDYAARIMGLCLGILPLIVVFLIGSKNFIRGLTSGAVKG